MKKLTQKKYWETIYNSNEQIKNENLKKKLKKIFPSVFLKYFSAYYDFLLWDVVLPKYLKEYKDGESVIEIGSAPGNFLVKFSKRFRKIPFGVEYTALGAKKNREIFKQNNINPKNIFEMDFLSKMFLENNRGLYDIVISRGFIEHFKKPSVIVGHHIEILRPGGLLIVLIPNLTGIYYFWTKMFNPKQLNIHNLEIMKIQNFEELFRSNKIHKLQSGYFGTFGFWLFTAPEKSCVLRSFIRMLYLVQRVLNLIFRLIFREKGCDSSFFSPNLIYIGRKI